MLIDDGVVRNALQDVCGAELLDICDRFGNELFKFRVNGRLQQRLRERGE